MPLFALKRCPCSRCLSGQLAYSLREFFEAPGPEPASVRALAFEEHTMSKPLAADEELYFALTFPYPLGQWLRPVFFEVWFTLHLRFA